jgi:hypothetical protein
MRKYGWVKDKYQEVENYHRPRVARLPASSGLTPYLPLVFNQDGVGCCTGCGISGMSSVVASKLGYQLPDKSLLYSVNWLYNWGRKIEGTLDKDYGASPSDIFDALNDHGYLFEIDWPFKDVLDETDPTTKEPLAFKYPNFQKVRVDNGIDGILSALGEKNPIAIGAPFFSVWDNPGKDGILSKVTTDSTVGGGHETFWYDYDLERELLLGQNSWGDWGKAGRYLMPFSAIPVFKSLGGYDAHYVQFDVNPTPVPPVPVPVKKECWLLEFLKNRKLANV